MGKKKKQFIDKKTAATFTIVQRKQGGNYDGEVVSGSKYMLQPSRYDTPLPTDFPLDLLQVPGHATDLLKTVEKREGKGEEDENDNDGDEEYNYEQHMRSIGSTGLSEGSSSVFIPNPSAPALDIRQKAVAAEGKDEDEGERLFSKAIKPERTGRLKLSKDLAKALEGEEGFDEIDDDFVLTAIHDQIDLKAGGIADEEDYAEGDLFSEDEGEGALDNEEEGDQEEEDEGDEEDEEEDEVVLKTSSAKSSAVKKVELITSKKTEPPAARKAISAAISGKGTSKGILNSAFAKHIVSEDFDEEEDEGDEYEGDEEEGDEKEEEENETEVNGRPKRLIDAQFDSLLEQYDDDEDIGELDPDNPELQGGVENLDDYAKEISEFTSRQEREYGGDQAVPISDYEKLKVIEKLEVQAAEGEESIATTHAKIDAMFAVTEKENWDCESIVSTYSNTENHPLMIKRPSKTSTKTIKLSSKTGIPIGYFPTREKPEAVQEEDEEEEEEEGDEVARGNLGAARNKTETKAEKQARKKEVKAARREARGRKKDLKLQYTAELNRQLTFEHHQQLHNPAVTKM